MKTLKVKNLGPIGNAEVNFGDLTLFVGPQASGKSILLQLIKLIVDHRHIRRTLEQYGFIWGNDEYDILERYFGEGMGGIWHKQTEVTFDKKAYPITHLLPRKRVSIKDVQETLFYIPAQRVVCLQNGWPRFFTEYEGSVPYVLRHFSETLRQELERGFGKNKETDTIFPQTKRLKESLRKSFNDSIFHDAKIVIDKTSKKRFKLELGGSSIPFMAWSAGQKEFMPLLLSFYWLCPGSAVSRKDSIEYVIIEEPEMGLHPQAITSILLQVIDLMNRGYKVIISTHSPVLLEFAWAVQILQQQKAGAKELAELFELKQLTPALKDMFTNILENKLFKTYSFNRTSSKVNVKDISSLDAGSSDPSTSEWGGLSSFSTKASDIILKVANNEEQQD
ncbi:AAA family ATPase [Chitinophaga sp. sic0106]|uniref:AAA family ATPase n=1 Tax=Chitinophaga sp. sic0106 TaxID=2854785 RepID=UPI001C48FC16|nr:ATP-binding protein [Chitinophaga sp. sic0106]MBV7533480.1 ATP-binding protein [Chitinophaga sp. sic0106]